MWKKTAKERDTVTFTKTQACKTIISKDMKKAIIYFGNEIALADNLTKKIEPLGTTIDQARDRLKQLGEADNFPEF